VFTRYGDGPVRAMMVGNSLISDVVPTIFAGSWGIYVPHSLTWQLEEETEPVGAERYRQISHLGELADVVREIG
jgi:putative hydrolase of the HAD superfamily